MLRLSRASDAPARIGHQAAPPTIRAHDASPPFPPCRRWTAAMPAKLARAAPADERAGLHAPARAGRGGLVHRAVATAGFAEFKPLTPGARKYLLGLVKNFSEADAVAIKEIEKTTNHDVKAVEYWIKSQVRGPARAAGGRRVRALRLHQRGHQQHQPRAADQGGARPGAAARARRPDRHAARHGARASPTCRCWRARTARPPARPRSARRSPTSWCAWPRRASDRRACSCWAR